MNVKILETNERRIHIVRFDADEPVVTALAQSVRERNIMAGTIKGRGRLSRLTVMRAPAGDATTVPCPADVVVLEGDVIREGDAASVTLQVLVVLGDGSVTGGRVAEATAASLEILIEESPLIPSRTMDPETGTAFADLGAGLGAGERGVAAAAASDSMVDEAAEESFPASDPPSFAGVPGD